MPILQKYTPHAAALLAPLLILTLSGCATLDKDECLNADWRRIGYTDGADGQSSSRINEHAHACAAYGVRPSLDPYLEGRKQGLLEYCQPGNGFDVGRRGNDDNAGECEAHLRPAFLEQYRRGQEIHDIENDIANRQSHIDSNDRQLRKDGNRIADIKAELQKTDLPNERRTFLLNEYDRLLEQKEKLGRDTRATRNEADRLALFLKERLKDFGR